MINDIEDNYSEYLNDTTGYTWDAWDTLTQNEISAHDKILGGQSPENHNLGHLGLWANSRRLFLAKDFAAFIELSQTIFIGEKSHASALVYPEIAALVCNTMVKTDRRNEAAIFLAARQKEYPQNVELKISAFILKASKDESFESELGEIKDAELLFDLCEGLLSALFVDSAQRCFSACEALVGEQPLSAIHVDLDSMRRKLSKAALYEAHSGSLKPVFKERIH